MSPRTRQSLLFALSAVLLALTLLPEARPVVLGGGGPESVEFKRFPRGIVAAAPALPGYARDGHHRSRQLLDSVNAMWEGAFRAAGGRYERPALTPPDAPCGAPWGGWAGLYCPGERAITIDTAGHGQRHNAVGQATADLILGYVVAHEVGHHVQQLRGAPADRLRKELHAQCLAGVWGRAAGQQLPPTWAYGEDSDHGTSVQQVYWLNEGYRSARPSDCETIWSTSTSP